MTVPSNGALRLPTLVIAAIGALVAALAAALPWVAQSNALPCYATATSMTPPSWRATPHAAQRTPKPGLKLVAEIPLPGPANRFDYQSVDTTTGRIYLNHMNAARMVVF